jgi:hypothetical protein
MEKKSICKSCVSTGKPFTNEHGTFYSFNVEFENGDKGLCSSKKDEAPYTVGKDEDYDIQAVPKKDGSGTYNKIKKVQQNKPFGFKKDPTIALKSYACSYATRLALAGIIKKPEGADGFDKFKTAIANSTKSFYKEMTAECTNYGMDNADIVGTCMSKAIDVCVEGIIPKEEIYSYYRNLLSAVLVKQQPAQA